MLKSNRQGTKISIPLTQKSLRKCMHMHMHGDAPTAAKQQMKIMYIYVCGRRCMQQINGYPCNKSADNNAKKNEENGSQQSYTHIQLKILFTHACWAPRTFRFSLSVDACIMYLSEKVAQACCWHLLQFAGSQLLQEHTDDSGQPTAACGQARPSQIEDV